MFYLFAFLYCSTDDLKYCILTQSFVEMVYLVMVRLFTHFPTGTLYSLRGITIGCLFLTVLGLIDDIKHKGLGFKTKFVFQLLGALVLISYDIKIRFVQPAYLGDLLTILWVVGVTNAFNIIDIMDGLAGGIAFCSALAFFFIALPGEQIFVNFAGVALAGACLGFLPYNLSQKQKIFMGDTGSLSIGFLLAAISLGTSYTRINEIGIYVPLLILGIPLFDTLFVMILRLRRGKSPFLGSKDHFALRMEAMGYPRKQIVLIACLATLVLSFCAWLITQVNIYLALIIYLLIIVAAVMISRELRKIEMN